MYIQVLIQRQVLDTNQIKSKREKNMNVIKTSGLLIPLILVGCGKEKNVEYFLSNPNEIQITTQECKSSLEYALKAKDEKRFKEINSSPECKAAFDADRTIENEKRADRRKALEEKQAEDKRLFDKEVASNEKQLSSMSIEQLSGIVQKTIDHCGSGYKAIKTPECVAFSNQKENIHKQLLNSVMTSYSYKSIEDFATKECQEDRYKFNCKLAQEAEDKLFNVAVEAFVDNTSLAIETYNLCVSLYTKTKNATNSRMKASQSVKTKECRAVREAISTLKNESKFNFKFREKISEVNL